MSKSLEPNIDLDNEVGGAARAQVKVGALENAILTSANFSSIATDAAGVIQIFNVGAEHMLGYLAADVMNKITPADISDPQELIARAEVLSAELGTPIAPGFEALVFKASRGIEDIYELTYIRKDGSRFPARVSVTALRDAHDNIIGYLLIGTDNTARKRADDKAKSAAQYARSLIEASLDPLVTISPEGKITDVNAGSIKVTGVPRENLIGTDFSDYFTEPEKAREGYQEAFSKGSVIDFPLTIRHQDGYLTEVLYNASVYRDAQGNVLGVFAAARDVTDQRQASQYARSLIEASLDPLVTISPEGKITDVNEGSIKVTGVLRENLIGTDFSDYFTEPEKAREGYRAAFSKGSVTDFPLTIRHEDGYLTEVLYNASVYKDVHGKVLGVFAAARDITARKQAEAALLKAGALQDAIFNSENFSCIATDAAGVIQIFNVGAERMLGYLAADVMNKITPADISDPQELIARAEVLSAELGTPIAPGFEALVFKASRGIEDIYEITYIRKDCSRFPARVSVTALRDAHNSIIGYLLIGTDNTARIQNEAERAQLFATLQDRNVELEVATALAEKANHAKSEFLSSMSHELRTPLNAILGFAQLLESGTPAPTASQQKRLQQIIKAGWYLLELINEILDLAVIESGQLTLSRESVLLADVVDECRAMMAPQAQARGIRLSFLHFDKRWYVSAESTRIKQVLINLMSNAIKYNREHGSIIVECTEPTPQRIRVSIKDSGEGLSQAKLDQLFQPFNRLGQEAGPVEGTGIGLVVTKQLVELMGGKIGVTSKLGVGSEFWFELNRDAQASTVDTQPPLEVLPPKIARDALALALTLLYMENDPANLLLVEQIIEGYPNIQMLSARDAIVGIEMARKQRPSVILMDTNLPGINGFEALAFLRNDPLTADIPILAISADAMTNDIQNGKDAGFLDYLTKPIRVNEFITALTLAMKQVKPITAKGKKKA